MKLLPELEVGDQAILLTRGGGPEQILIAKADHMPSYSASGHWNQVVYVRRSLLVGKQASPELMCLIVVDAPTLAQEFLYVRRYGEL